jgi:hypothetical protein
LKKSPILPSSFGKHRNSRCSVFLLTSISRDVLVQIAALPSAVAVRKHIEEAFVSQSHARAINTRMALVSTQKGSMTVAEYVSKMKSLANDMASAGKKLDDEEITSYILAGLDFEYNSVVSSIAARVDPISLGKLYSQLLAHETRLDLRSQGTGGQSPSSVNTASRGRGGFTRGHGDRGPGGHGGNASGGHDHGDSSYKPRNKYSPCQMCGKTNHSVFKCYKWFDPAYMGEEKNANVAVSYGVDSNWYADSGAMDHVTGELDKLALKDAYGGNEQIYNASGSGMRIEHLCESVIHTPYRDLRVKHALHVPQATKNLASVHRIATDNNIFFELHPIFFFIKDRELRRTLIHGRSKGGLYPIPCAPLHEVKQVLGVSKLTTSRWHSHLGHPSSSIVRCVLRKNNIPCVSDFILESVCDAC